MDPKRGSFQSRNGHIWQVWPEELGTSGIGQKVGQKVAKTRNQGDFGKSGHLGTIVPKTALLRKRVILGPKRVK